jgi:WhiB family redox-sensing transcriptional regulator
MSLSRLTLPDAACNGADPRLFDATSGELVEDALSYCDRCPVVKECEEVVRPKRSYFDGVAAGKVWKDGARVELALFN